MSPADTASPDGIDADHIAPGRRRSGRASFMPLLILASVMALALSGLLAGGKSRPRQADFAQAQLTLKAPQRLRNGEFFEMQADVKARRDIGNLTVAIDAAVWKDMTINSMIPAASEERFENGKFVFAYGALKAGETLTMKIDGQINPPLTWGTEGRISLMDDKTVIGVMPVSIRVLP